MWKWLAGEVRPSDGCHKPRPCGAVARSTRYSAPRARGTPQPISLMDRRGAGGAGWLPQVGTPAAGWRGDRSRRRAGSAGDARRRACKWNGPQHVQTWRITAPAAWGSHPHEPEPRAALGETRGACDITGMAGRRSGGSALRPGWRDGRGKNADCATVAAHVIVALDVMVDNDSVVSCIRAARRGHHR